MLVAERGEPVQILFGRLDRRVHAHMGQIEKERTLLVFLDELQGLTMQGLGQIALKAGNLVVAINGGVVIVKEIPDPFDAAIGQRPAEPRMDRMFPFIRIGVQVEMARLKIAVEIVEAPVRRKERFTIAHVPFPYGRGRIAFLTKKVAEGFFMDIKAPTACACGPMRR